MNNTNSIGKVPLQWSLEKLSFLTLIYCLLIAGHTSAVETYPARPIRLIVPFPPGGGADTLARTIGKKLGDSWGQSVVIDNRPGGATNIAAELAVNSLPDGYTLLESVLSHAVNVSLYSKLNYDLEKHLSPVIFLATIPNILVVHPSVPVKSTRELIEYGRTYPNVLNYASTGNGSPQHLGMELFKHFTQSQFTQITYKGATPAHTDLVSGQVQVMFANMLSSLPLIRANRLRALAISSSKRSPLVKEIPTVMEIGVPNFETGSWFGISVPAKTPTSIVNKLNTEMNLILKEKTLLDKMNAEGAELMGGNVERYQQFIHQEIKKWSIVVHTANIRLD